MILIAHKTQAADQEARPRFWIDAREEAALTVHVYEQYETANSSVYSTTGDNGSA